MNGSKIDINGLAELIDKSGYTVVVLGDKFTEDLGYVMPSPYHAGLWRKLGKYLTLKGFTADPEGAWGFYKGLYEKAIELDNNNTYKNIIEMIKRGLVQAVITTSIDGVLSRFKSLNIIELSGNIRRAKCMREKHFFDTEKVIKEKMYRCPDDGDPIRPDIVFYDEEVSEREWIRAIVEISAAELVIVAGLDPVIAPYNMLPLVARVFNRKLVVIDTSTWGAAEIADAVLSRSPSSIWRELLKTL